MADLPVGRITFTRGPWGFDPECGDVWSDRKRGGNICEVFDPDGKPFLGKGRDAEAIANARLIAAAPELLAAIKEMVACCTNDEGAVSPEPHDRHKWLLSMMAARAAIAKAEGSSHG